MEKRILTEDIRRELLGLVPFSAGSADDFTHIFPSVLLFLMAITVSAQTGTPNTDWANKGADNLDGADITRAEILADGTIGGRFTEENGWTVQNGHLPGLFGQTVPLPVHLGGTSVNPQLRQRQNTNASSFNMRVSPAKGSISNISYTLNTESILSISVYNLKGKKIASQPKRLRTAGEHNFSFKAPKGFYIVEAKVQGKTGVGEGDAKHRVFTERVLVR
ncbi:MAG: T9SS type A sorting domain-containing protein [Chitinispirillia bacterium]|nr:T9SS type A sorting domain-containing protein [Chitinispirillia bacterium]